MLSHFWLFCCSVRLHGDWREQYMFSALRDSVLSMMHSKHMESCDQLLESYDKEIMDVFKEVRACSEHASFVAILRLLFVKILSFCVVAPARQAV